MHMNMFLRISIFYITMHMGMLHASHLSGYKQLVFNTSYSIQHYSFVCAQ